MLKNENENENENANMEIEEAKRIIKDSIDEAKTTIDLFRIILEKTYEKGVEDGRSEHQLTN